MTKNHLKRLPAPKTWRIGKKEETYVTRPNPGGHELELAMPLGTVMKYLGLAETNAEVKHIMQYKEILVDGKERHDIKHPVGFMDVLSIPSGDKHYRIIITNKGLEALEIDEEEAGVKAVKITGKTDVKGGQTQIHTMDGRTMLLDEDDYDVGDSLLLEIPAQDIKEHLELKEGATILLYKGRHAGDIGEVKEIEGNKITFTSGDEEFETRTEYAFVIGKDEPVIQVE